MTSTTPMSAAVTEPTGMDGDPCFCVELTGSDQPVISWTIPKSQAIQMCYPDEPNWEEVEEEVLVKLVEEFEWEQSCATSAILQLSLRGANNFRALANWLLTHPAADQWLKAAAADALDLRTAPADAEPTTE